jgi:ATP-dependent DNA ligase
LKYDGFRALAYIEHGRCTLVSRNGTDFASFSVLSSAIGASLSNGRAVLDGEIAVLMNLAARSSTTSYSIVRSPASLLSTSSRATAETSDSML